MNAKNNVVESDRVLSLHRREVRFETGFSLAVFPETPKAVFAERGSRSVGGVSIAARNDGLVPRCGMCIKNILVNFFTYMYSR